MGINRMVESGRCSPKATDVRVKVADVPKKQLIEDHISTSATFDHFPPKYIHRPLSLFEHRPLWTVPVI